MDFESSRKVLARYISDKQSVFRLLNLQDYRPFGNEGILNYGEELLDREKEYIYESLRILQQFVLDDVYAIHFNLKIYYTERRVFEALKKEHNIIKERVENLENIHNKCKENQRPYQLVDCLEWFKELDEILDEIFNSDKMENPHKKDKENRGRVNIEAHDSSKINVTIGNNSPIHNDENAVVKQKEEEKGKTIWNNIIVGIISTVVGGIIVFLITKYWVL